MKTNLTGWERFLRVLVGAGLMAAGITWFSATEAFGFRAFAVAVVLIGLDLAVTGVIGFCPLYQKLGWRTILTPRAVK